MRPILCMALSFFLNHGAACADSSCWEEYQEVSLIEEWDFLPSAQNSFYLPSRNLNGRFMTPAAAHFDRALNSVQIHFDFETKKMSLPYNLYRIEIEAGTIEQSDHFLHTIDFTNNCEGPGASIYPHGQIYLPYFEIPPHEDGRSRSGEPFHIKIWGHL